MTDNDLASLEPLEPLAGAAPAAAQHDPMASQRAGMGAPAFNMFCTDSSMYRFLFAGVMMFVGCMMPTSADLSVAGYQTVSGGFYLLIAIALIWSWWGSIANNRSMGVKWVLLAMFPLVACVWNTIAFDAAAAVRTAEANQWLVNNWVVEGEDAAFIYSDSIGSMFGDMVDALLKDRKAGVRCSGFWRLYGAGNLFLLLGALLAEVGLIMGVVGGMQQNKKATQEKRMKAAERKRK